MSKKELYNTTLIKNKILNLLKDSSQITPIQREDSYIETYPHFISYFENLTEISYHDAVIGAHAVYGWMPTVLNIHTSDKEVIEALLKDVKAGKDLDSPKLTKLKSWMNNSIVGVSKLLHFICPERYPIWDSNINAVLFEAKSGYKTNDVERYIEYKVAMLECASDENFINTIRTGPISDNSAALSGLRLIEMRLFYIGKARNHKTHS